MHDIGSVWGLVMFWWGVHLVGALPQYGKEVLSRRGRREGSGDPSWWLKRPSPMLLQALRKSPTNGWVSTCYEATRRPLVFDKVPMSSSLSCSQGGSPGVDGRLFRRSRRRRRHHKRREILVLTRVQGLNPWCSVLNTGGGNGGLHLSAIGGISLRRRACPEA